MPAASCKTCMFTCKVPESRPSSLFPICSADHQPGESLPTPGPADILVLLYYSYVSIEDIDGAVTWHKELCSHLGLKGRVRIAREGVNVVLDGVKHLVQTYQDAVVGDGRWGNIQFKVGGLNQDKPMEEQRFPTLSVKTCAEVVSIGLRPEDFPHTAGAPHLPPSQWHRKLQELEQCPDQGKDVVLIDTRNIYESRIGQFQCKGATTLVPPIRQFTDFPKYIDEHVGELKGKTVLMYCTGGVRCERASAYVMRRLEEAEGEEGGEAGGRASVYQLEGGICSYLDAQLGAPSQQHAASGDQGPLGRQPSGEQEGSSRSFFAGKNFVFDRRRFQPQHDGQILGSCHVCHRAHDDYDNGPECRCRECRLLLLLCDACRNESEWPLSANGCIQTLLCGADCCLATSRSQQQRKPSSRARRKAAASSQPSSASAVLVDE